ncbi:MAG: AmmeMemoRadiSam system protein B [Acidobacteriota bacterium]
MTPAPPSLPDAPCLRWVDAIPIDTEQGPRLCLRDRERYATSIVLLPMTAVPLVMLMDGRHTIRDIQESYVRGEGDFVTTDEVRAVVEMLDQQFFLDSDRFRELKAAVDREFRESAVRPASSAGLSYPDDPAELAALLDSFFDAPGGAGRPSVPRAPLAAVLAPHIDYRRGGPAYSAAYRAIAEGAEGVDTFVILATAHMGGASAFAITRKDFETPLGTVPCNRPFVDELASALSAAGVDPFAEETLHRSEHSAELQVVYLQHLFGRERHFHVVPVLVGSMHEILRSGGDPMDDPAVAAFVGALRDGLVRRSGRVMVIGGVDLAHVGPQFGDPRPVSEGDLAIVGAADRCLLDRVAAGDARGLLAHLRQDMDARRICGFPPILTMLLAMSDLRGEVLRYDQWPDPNGTVTFASVVFPRA